MKYPKRIRKSWSLTIASWRKKWKYSARYSTYQISPGKKWQKRNRITVAGGKAFSEAVLIGNGNSRLHSIEVSNNPSAINSGVVVWCCFPVEIFSLFVWTYWAFCFNIQISKAKQDLENQKAESDKKINPSRGIVQDLHTVLIGDFGGTKNCPKWTTMSGKGCAGCPRSIWTRSTYMVSHIWGGTSQFRFMLTVDTKRSIGVWLGFPIKKTVIIIFTWAYILFLSSFHAWLSCMAPQALTLTLKSISELY